LDHYASRVLSFELPLANPKLKTQHSKLFLVPVVPGTGKPTHSSRTSYAARGGLVVDVITVDPDRDPLHLGHAQLQRVLPMRPCDAAGDQRLIVERDGVLFR
jgi:hypothetical protein